MIDVNICELMSICIKIENGESMSTFSDKEIDLTVEWTMVKMQLNKQQRYRDDKQVSKVFIETITGGKI